MRRGLSILLVLVFGIGPLSFALPGAEDANLPACCRREGAHHCAMASRMAAMMARAFAGQTCISAPETCPSYPGPMLAVLMPAAHAIVAEPAAPPSFESSTRALLPADAADLAGPSRAHAGRGPPATIAS